MKVSCIALYGTTQKKNQKKKPSTTSGVRKEDPRTTRV